MELLDEKTVRDLAIAHPAAARIFDKFAIDYCCGGEKSLAHACAAAKVNLHEVVEALEKPVPSEIDRNWQTASLVELTRHIVEKHHEYVRQEIPRLVALLAKVVRVHGQNHRELHEIARSFRALADELTHHLPKEERMLFPYIETLEIAANAGTSRALPMFGTVRNPVHRMTMEHDSASEFLRKIRQLTRDYRAPEDACMSFQMLYRGLREFEADLEQHMHLENSVLFPRAIVLEDQATSPR